MPKTICKVLKFHGTYKSLIHREDTLFWLPCARFIFVFPPHMRSQKWMLQGRLINLILWVLNSKLSTMPRKSQREKQRGTSALIGDAYNVGVRKKISCVLSIKKKRSRNLPYGNQEGAEKLGTWTLKSNSWNGLKKGEKQAQGWQESPWGERLLDCINCMAIRASRLVADGFNNSREDTIFRLEGRQRPSKHICIKIVLNVLWICN